ncbi:hypothetical protein [Roseovarius sp. 217]|uniref:hypothetical protein n=1 Tax=Roseovarius sp. (strain 217) TaxID=314264 RepID=UPI00032535B6|nr:hypothetical protein [Roseovarius sp. 217]
MSVLSVIVRPADYVLLGADGVCTDPSTGAVVSYIEKIRVYPSLSCAIGVTGIGKIENIMDWFMPKSVHDFDHLVEFLPELVWHAQDYMIKNELLSCDDIRSNVVAAGWSKRDQKFAAYRVVTYPKESLDRSTGKTVTLEPWVAHEITESGTWTSCAPDANALQICGLNEAHDEDDAAVMSRMICAGRQSSGKITQDGMSFQFNAGRFVQLALVKQSHCQTWIAHHWPEDVIGQPVDPARGSVLPPHLSLGHTE